MNVLSLFDGISGGQVALKRVGIKVDNYYGSEVDEYAIKIAEKNFPNMISIGDIRKVSYKEGILYSENGIYEVGKIDLIMAGSPCQSLSFAGKQKGLATSENIKILTLEDYLYYKENDYTFSGQSYLFWEFIRILREVNPKYFLLENVNMSAEWKEVFTRTVGVEPIRINSNLVSAQNRDRLYWTNISNKIEQPKDRGILLRDILIEEVDEKNLYPLSKAHYDGFMRSYPHWKESPIDGKSKPILASYYKQPPHCPYVKSKTSESGYRRLSAVECERLQTLDDNYTEGVSNSQRLKTIGTGWTIEVIVHILSYIK